MQKLSDELDYEQSSTVPLGAKDGRKKNSQKPGAQINGGGDRRMDRAAEEKKKQDRNKPVVVGSGCELEGMTGLELEQRCVEHTLTMALSLLAVALEKQQDFLQRLREYKPQATARSVACRCLSCVCMVQDT